MNAELKNYSLYLVLDTQVCGYERLFEILKTAVNNGVDIIQLRDKSGPARETLQFATRVVGYLRRKVPFIVNDRVDIAKAAKADGVHLGQDDLPLESARRILGKRAIIGLSCQTLDQARLAQKGAADYIGFGSVFKTLTKPGRSPMRLKFLKTVCQEIRIPVFAIGGIDLENICQLKKYRIQRVAVTRAICAASDVESACRELRKILKS